LLVASRDQYGGYGQDATAREHVSLFSVLRRRALIIFVATVLAGGAAAAFALVSEETYQSTAKLLFKQTIGPDLNAQGLLPSPGDADNLAANNVQVVDSREVATQTARDLQGQGIDLSTDDVEKDVAVTAAKDTDVVNVDATASSAQRAALLARTYSSNAAEMAAAADKAQARRSLAEVERQLAALPAGQENTNNANDLRNSANRLETIAAVGTGSPEIIQQGFVPTAESRNVVQLVVLGTVFGLLLGVGLALVREQSDRKLRRTEQVTAAFEAPVLTTVPRSRALKRHKPFVDLPPQVAEAFRMLQMNLRFAREDPVRSVLVTSARTGEGKTTVSWNLAAAAASGGLSVALVEADLRRPSLADRYELEASPGLTEALLGEVSIAAALQSTLPSGGDPSAGRPRALHVMAAGGPAANPWALMQSSIMPRVLDALRHDHDLVVIDTPPIPHVADAISLLRQVDGVLITASVNATRGADATRLRDQLEGLDANVLGVVANGGSAISGYAAYARATAAVSSNGHPGVTITVPDRTDQPRV
jgi:polysaccharide biosynthesis transport protein